MKQAILFIALITLCSYMVAQAQPYGPPGGGPPGGGPPGGPPGGGPPGGPGGPPFGPPAGGPPVGGPPGGGPPGGGPPGGRPPAGGPQPVPEPPPSAPAPEPLMTDDGLPRRRRQSHLAPQLRDRVDADLAASGRRPPDDGVPPAGT